MQLDGGGAHSLSQLYMLKHIMAAIEGNPEPCNVFDLICGSSTGGYVRDVYLFQHTRTETEGRLG
jgi:patatin-like phospholipase/acyl hydrolase